MPHAAVYNTIIEKATCNMHVYRIKDYDFVSIGEENIAKIGSYRQSIYVEIINCKRGSVYKDSFLYSYQLNRKIDNMNLGIDKSDCAELLAQYDDELTRLSANLKSLLALFCDDASLREEMTSNE